MFNTSNQAQYEWGLIIVKNQDGLIYAKNQRTDSDPQQVDLNYHLDAHEILIGEEHDHCSLNNPTDPLDRSSPTTTDVLDLSAHISILNYFSFVNCGNLRYAIVIENATKFQSFKSRYIHPEKVTELFKSKSTLAIIDPAHISNWQLATQKALISVIGNSLDNGTGIYITDDLAKPNFIKLN